MASFQFDGKSSRARFFFRHGGKQFNKTVPVESRKKAEWQLSTIEETLAHLDSGKLTLPDNADIGIFILSGGKETAMPRSVSEPPKIETSPPTLATIFDTYSQDLTPGSKEANTIYLEALHGRHFKRVMGVDCRFDSLSV